MDFDRDGSEVPMVKDCHVTAEEIKIHGPHIRSALPQYERMVDFISGWSSANYQK